MPREAALKARENLRATINETHLEGTDYSVFGKRGPKVEKDDDYRRKNSSSAGSSKRHRCGYCSGCFASNCGKCTN